MLDGELVTGDTPVPVTPMTCGLVAAESVTVIAPAYVIGENAATGLKTDGDGASATRGN